MKMITKEGYSKDPNIIPEGIVVTFGKDMINEQGGLKKFLIWFNYVMENWEEGYYWMHKCKNNPKNEFDHVYIIIANRLYGRVLFGGRKNGQTTGGTADNREVDIDWPYLVLSGPMELCPFKRKLSGFRGFRYCTKLF